MMKSYKIVAADDDTIIRTFRIKSKYLRMLEKEAEKEGTTASGALNSILKKWNMPQKSKIPYFH